MQQKRFSLKDNKKAVDNTLQMLLSNLIQKNDYVVMSEWEEQFPTQGRL